MPLCSLPEEIILSEILPRLPVKSLLRFKWASKQWFSVISSHRFAKTQLELSAKCNTDCNAILVSHDYGNCCIISHHPVGSLFSQSTMYVDQLESCQHMSKDRPRLGGCCNGLCCVLLDKKTFTLWNPSTRESHRLPPVLNEFLHVTVHGFGYDESNDDYKVVTRLQVKSKYPRCEFILRLYSLKTNSWKTINNFFGCDAFGGAKFFGGKGTLVNGKLHWMSNLLKIVSFDLGTEAAGVVEAPSFKLIKRPFPCMGEIKGCLCVIYDNSEEGTEVWVLKEYGMKESWCKVSTVPYLGTYVNNLYKHPICISEDRVVIGDTDNRFHLLIYYPETEIVRSLKLNIFLRLISASPV